LSGLFFYILTRHPKTVWKKNLKKFNSKNFFSFHEKYVVFEVFHQ